MPFIDIAFAAEISRYEDAEFEDVARRNCGEDPETRHKDIQHLREMIKERGECNPRRLDDAYLLRFLRCRRFIPALAHKLVDLAPQTVPVHELTHGPAIFSLAQIDRNSRSEMMVRYEDFRRQNAFLYECSAFGLESVRHVYAGTLPDNPLNGRITLMRFGRWESELVPIEDVVRCALLMDEVAAMQPRLQVLGITIVVDLEGLGVRHVRHLTRTVASQIVALMGVSFPINIHAVHVVRYNWFLSTFFNLFQQFIPEAAWKRLHFHGYDMASLHKHIKPEHLPPEYGGSCQHVISTEEWIRKINKYKDEFMVKELRALGFKVED
ncbi:clavesin-1-like isoform X1 [Leptidea sinapis]|uniref:clavesin-1-like isoform X1 n=1 Tax=Leptidea sinapis TaxID=189913 RepID=UPI00213ADEC5|nr:clavesin-1-like isoform X1 [Leptidea sinapis]